MSAVVLPFVGKPKAAAPPEKPHYLCERYFCQNCKGEKFHALDNGKMRCATCGAGIKNLTVIFHPEPA